MQKVTVTKTAYGFEVKINGDQWGIYGTEAEAQKMASSLQKTDIGN